MNAHKLEIGKRGRRPRGHVAITTVLRLLLLTVMAFGIQFIMFIDVAADDALLGTSLRSEIIDSVCQKLITVYPYVDVTEKMVDHLRKNLTAGVYDEVNSNEDFCSILTDELRDISGDLHIKVSFELDEFLMEREVEPTEAVLQAMFDEEAYDNFGFERVERLPGNVGYIKMHRFNIADWAGPTAVAAMNFIGHCDAVIFDLRSSLGGSPTMNQLLLSYLFDEPIHFNSFHYGVDDSVKQFWSHAFVTGPRLSKAYIYVLVNKNTVSAAEGFAYALKHLKRATVVGETTRGGAHPAGDYTIPNLNIVMSIPYGYAVNPVTKTNWEGTGVRPDIETDAQEALNIAYMVVLDTLRSRCSTSARCSRLDWAIVGLRAKINPVYLSSEELEQYTGTYGDLEFVLMEGRLIIKRSSGTQIELEPMLNDIFGRPDLEFIRYQFLRDEQGNVNGVALLIYGGQRREIPRNN